MDTTLLAHCIYRSRKTDMQHCPSDSRHEKVERPWIGVRWVETASARRESHDDVGGATTLTFHFRAGETELDHMLRTGTCVGA